MSKTAVYGLGVFGKLFLKALSNNVEYIIDDFSKETYYENIPIKRLSEIEKNTKIYISPLQFSKQIEKKLLSEGFTNIVNFTEAIKQLPNILELISKTNYLWLVEDKNKMVNDDKLSKVHSLLIDTQSKEILQSIVNLRKTLDPTYYIIPSETEYFPQSVPVLKNLESVRFIDCGAYTGDTVEELCQQVKCINYAISFEPDTNNLNYLEKTLHKLKHTYIESNFFSFPVGVYSSNKILSFTNHTVGASSAICEQQSTTHVPVVSLDSVILNSNPNFIKMDIEGAEKEAIIGAKKVIRRYKPNLAICLYHKPEDLWELPLLIHEIEPTYDMYIRVHEDLCLSTVLYCISKDIKCIN